MTVPFVILAAARLGTAPAFIAQKEVDAPSGLEVVVLLPVRSEVDGDADGVPVPRSLVLPDGPWLHPVASAAMSEKAETPQSSFFMNTPPAEFGRDCGAASEVPPTPRWRP